MKSDNDLISASLEPVAFIYEIGKLWYARNAGSFLRWQSCIGLPSRAKLALRRTAMESIVILTLVHPFATSWHFAPVGSVSLDSRSPLAPYESSSLATSRGNEKFRGAFLLFA